MPSNSITLVGRASSLEFESGGPLASFTLTTQRRRQSPLVLRCEGRGKRILEQFELMDEGSLVGIIGTMTTGAVGALPLVRLDRLEYMGNPLEVAP